MLAGASVFCTLPVFSTEAADLEALQAAVEKAEAEKARSEILKWLESSKQQVQGRFKVIRIAVFVQGPATVKVLRF